MRRALAVLLLAAAACESNPLEPCPGTPQATLQFRGTLDGATEACAAASGAATAPAFTAVVSFVDDATAAICIQRALAEPILAARDGDALLGATAAKPASVRDCACAARVVEELEGTLVRDGARAVSFQGELRNDVAPADADSCVETGASCPSPCQVRWTLVGD